MMSSAMHLCQEPAQLCSLHRQQSRCRWHACRAHQSAAQQQNHSEAEIATRRGLLAAGAAVTLLANMPRPACADADGLVEYKPEATKTPSLRSGVINAKDSYRFSLPPSWKEQKIANIQSGNFCMPRCDEPWTEASFADSSQGKAQLLVTPLRRLISKANATLDQIGTPDSVLASVGPFITGVGGLDEEEVLSAEKKTIDGRTFYVYEVNSLSATNGPRSLTALTTKADLAYLFTVSASEKQWAKSKGVLKRIVTTFHV